MSLKEMFEYTLLNPMASPEEVEMFCQQTMVQGYERVIVPPYFLKDCVEWFVANGGNHINTGTVVGFPYGFNSYRSKFEELKQGMEAGGKEFNVVLNHHAIKSKNIQYLEGEIEGFMSQGRLKNKVIKLIIETPQLEIEDIHRVADLCVKHEVDFLKTATGTKGPTSIETIKALRTSYGSVLKLKASGGIRTKEEVSSFVEAGANRVGSSSTIIF